MARPPNNVHTLEQRLFIVRRLAAFEPPRAITAAFAALFPDTACNENDVLANDPSVAGNVVPFELYTAFQTERQRVMLDPSSDPFSDQKARLILLSNHVRFHNSNNEFGTARTVLDQIARELGVIGPGAGKPGKKEDENATPEFKSIEVRRTVVEPTMEPEITE